MKGTDDSVTCALCLGTLGERDDNQRKICRRCFEKHNLLKLPRPVERVDDNKREAPDDDADEETTTNGELDNGFKCNLCEDRLASVLKLQEHLIEHTFMGCKDRGYVCYLCSSIFTTAVGLQMHIVGHGLDSKPYECRRCDEKFFFRSELDHHSLGHAPLSERDKEEEEDNDEDAEDNQHDRKEQDQEQTETRGGVKCDGSSKIKVERDSEDENDQFDDEASRADVNDDDRVNEGMMANEELKKSPE